MSVFLFEKEYCLLEPCEGKLSRTVLRGESTRKGADLPDPTLGQDVQSFISANGNEIKHHYIDLNNPEQSPRVNPIQPDYLLNTSYAREFAQAIVANLIKESIKKPDFWNRSATDLLTACIW